MLFSSSELKQFANISIFFAGESILLTPLVYLFSCIGFGEYGVSILRCCYPLLVYRSLQSPCLFSTLLAGLCGACHSWSYIKIKESSLAAIIVLFYMFLYIANVLMHQTLWFGFSGEIYLLDYLPDSPEFQKLAQK